MAIGVIDRQPFGDGSAIEGLVGRDQRHRTESGLLALLADFERGGRLHGVVFFSIPYGRGPCYTQPCESCRARHNA